MKQKLFKAFALLLTLITVMSLVACGGGDSKDTDLTGTTWALSGGSQGDTTVDKATLETLFGGEMTYTFEEGGKMTAAAAGVEVEGTWTQDGSEVTMDVQGQSSTMTIDGDKLLLKQGDITVEFTKK
ncbi:hypothetical protein ACTQ33_00760 [Candidatus Avoscillospira sp. LCP25S3_F1]|uniref:hypothetical protein n=1 Tax=Candidatus Avoscillospira sp. LCP25S3_F1 TaxID=3438825 RepID=UPI003F8FF3CF